MNVQVLVDNTKVDKSMHVNTQRCATWRSVCVITPKPIAYQLDVISLILAAYMYVPLVIPGSHIQIKPSVMRRPLSHAL